MAYGLLLGLPAMVYPVEYEPFTPPKATDSRYCADIYANIASKCALASVCKAWRQLSLPLLFEIVIIHRTSQAAALKDFLERQPEYRRFVKAAIIRPLGHPYQDPSMEEDVDWIPSEMALAIVGMCPTLDVLSQPWWFPSYSYGSCHQPMLALESINRSPPSHRDHFGLWNPQHNFATAAPSLANITRLDWVYGCSPNVYFFHSMLRHMHSLRYLYVSSHSQYTDRYHPLDAFVRVPSLTTLRLRIHSPELINGIKAWQLPALTHFILDACPRRLGQHQLQTLARTFHARLQVVELGAHMQFLLADYVSPLLRACPGLRRLAFHLSFAALPAPGPALAALEQVSVHIMPNEFSLDAYHELGVVPATVLRFAEWCARLQTLECVRLYGNWGKVLTDPHAELVQARRVMGCCRCRFELQDGHRVDFAGLV